MKLRKRKSSRKGEWPYWFAAIVRHDGDENDKAMADLFVAAPEMLGALEDCLEDLERYARQTGSGPAQRLERARAAIAKATGKT